MPGIDAPQSCRAVHDLAAVGATLIHAARARELARRALELPIGRERHPERIECGDVAVLDHQTYLSLPPNWPVWPRRSEAGRVGKEETGTCRTGGYVHHQKK